MTICPCGALTSNGHVARCPNNPYYKKETAMVEQPEATTAPHVHPEHDPWKHRAKGMRCASCMWFVRKEPTGPATHEGQHVIGRCRRHAPSMNGYPVVYETDWCGDHRVDENKV